MNVTFRKKMPEKLLCKHWIRPERGEKVRKKFNIALS